MCWFNENNYQIGDEIYFANDRVVCEDCNTKFKSDTRATYAGHAAIDGEMRDVGIPRDLVCCPECNSVFKTFYWGCDGNLDDSMAEEFFVNAISSVEVGSMAVRERILDDVYK